jgi:tetratricopeptide (TPR) repeat protein
MGAELHFDPARDRRVSFSDEALAIARRLDDPSTLAAVLAARFVAIHAPDNLDERLANVAELDDVAARLQDPVVKSDAKSIRFRLMMEIADIVAADRCLVEWVALAEELGQPVIRWMVGWPRAGRIALSGRLAEAERAATEAMELGRATGQADAGVIFAFGLLPIRLQQGRMAEFEVQFLEMVERQGLSERLPLVVATRALIDAELGRLDRARRELEAMAASGFAGCPVDVTWSAMMAMWATVSAKLGDPGSAALLREALEPYPDVLVYMATFNLGTVAFHLGLLSGVVGDFAAADRAFAHAAAIEDRIDARSWLARTRLEWARILLRRSDPGDVERARPLLTRAEAAARELGLAPLEAQAGALLLDVP